MTSHHCSLVSLFLPKTLPQTSRKQIPCFTSRKQSILSIQISQTFGFSSSCYRCSTVSLTTVSSYHLRNSLAAFPFSLSVLTSCSCCHYYVSILSSFSQCIAVRTVIFYSPSSSRLPLPRRAPFYLPTWKRRQIIKALTKQLAQCSLCV